LSHCRVIKTSPIDIFGSTLFIEDINCSDINVTHCYIAFLNLYFNISHHYAACSIPAIFRVYTDIDIAI